MRGVSAAIVMAWSVGCAHEPSAPVPNGRPDAQLHLEVTPREGAEVRIDGVYQGYIERWRDQVVPVTSGQLRVEVRAPGRVSRRFDVAIKPGELVTLRVKLEPEWDDVPEPVTRPSETERTTQPKREP